MRKGISIPPEEQEEYILLENTVKNYPKTNGWDFGITIKRVSIWLSGNGCGVKQAYFVPVDFKCRPQIAWQDHVEPVKGQLKLDI